MKIGYMKKEKTLGKVLFKKKLMPLKKLLIQSKKDIMNLQIYQNINRVLIRF